MKKKQPKKEFVPVCPKCGSKDFQTSGIWGWAGAVGFPFGTEKYRCPDCGHDGTFVHVEKGKVKDFQKKLKANKASKRK